MTRRCGHHCWNARRRLCRCACGAALHGVGAPAALIALAAADYDYERLAHRRLPPPAPVRRRRRFLGLPGVPRQAVLPLLLEDDDATTVPG